MGGSVTRGPIPRTANGEHDGIPTHGAGRESPRRVDPLERYHFTELVGAISAVRGAVSRDPVAGCVAPRRGAGIAFEVRQDNRPASVASGAMIRLNEQIRLTGREVERFVKITALEPADIHTFADFDAYIARCKAHYWGISAETRFLHWLIDRERDRCVSAMNASGAVR